MRKPGDDERYKDSGQPLPYRAEADVDRVVGKRRLTNRIDAKDPRGKLEDYPLAKIYRWQVTSRE